MLELKFAVLEQ